MTLTRYRDDSDVGACVEALRAVFETSGYPTNWPNDPAGWLRPPGILRAWVAAAEKIPVAGHVILMQALPGERSAEVSRLFVAPAARRQGVASELLETVMRTAAARRKRTGRHRTAVRSPCTVTPGAVTRSGRPYCRSWRGGGSLRPGRRLGGRGRAGRRR
jgi:GNAT superfamily N-acetyltransferase